MWYYVTFFGNDELCAYVVKIYSVNLKIEVINNYRQNLSKRPKIELSTLILSEFREQKVKQSCKMLGSKKLQRSKSTFEKQKVNQ